MPNQPDLDDLLGELIQRFEAGDSPHVEEYVSKYPHWQDELIEFFQNQAWINAGSLNSTYAFPPPIVAPSLVGMRVGPYDLTSEIARGGMGVVYRGRHHEISREVAVKLISNGALASNEERERFRMETEAAGGLQHPNIVPIYEVGSWRGQTFYSMALVEGESLEDWVCDQRATVQAAATAVRDIARATHYAHGRGIVHRDIKPANVLIDADGRPMLTDFGLAKLQRRDTDLTQTGQILGTPNFMSPEQASGSSQIGPASDIYSLGAILYALLVGQPPHTGDSVPEILSQLHECDPIPPRQIDPAVPADLQSICMRCLQRVPSDRYDSAEALADDLDRFLSGESVVAAGDGMLSSFARTIRRDAHHRHFHAWGRALVLMGICIFLAHVAMFLLVEQGMSERWAYWIPRSMMFALLIGIIYYYREGSLRPRSSPERPIWSIWVGYLSSLATVNIVISVQGFSQTQIFPISCALAGFGFVAMGGHLWGFCYLLGALFFACSILSLAIGPTSILCTGVCWLIAMSALGYQYRECET